MGERDAGWGVDWDWDWNWNWNGDGIVQVQVQVQGTVSRYKIGTWVL